LANCSILHGNNVYITKILRTHHARRALDSPWWAASKRGLRELLVPFHTYIRPYVLTFVTSREAWLCNYRDNKSRHNELEVHLHQWKGLQQIVVKNTEFLPAWVSPNRTHLIIGFCSSTSERSGGVHKVNDKLTGF